MCSHRGRTSFDGGNLTSFEAWAGLKAEVIGYAPVVLVDQMESS